MIDPGVRLRAADLVRRFRDQQITNDQFEDGYGPLRSSSDDRALGAISSFIWTLYSDQRESLLADGQPYPDVVRQMLDRCIAFLESGEEYGWERDNFIGIAGITPLWRKLRLGWRRLRGGTLPAHLRMGPDTEVDWEVWPFCPDRR